MWLEHESNYVRVGRFSKRSTVRRVQCVKSPVCEESTVRRVHRGRVHRAKSPPCEESSVRRVQCAKCPAVTGRGLKGPIGSRLRFSTQNVVDSLN